MIDPRGGLLTIAPVTRGQGTPRQARVLLKSAASSGIFQVLSRLDRPPEESTLMLREPRCGPRRTSPPLEERCHDARSPDGRGSRSRRPFHPCLSASVPGRGPLLGDRYQGRQWQAAFRWRQRPQQSVLPRRPSASADDGPQPGGRHAGRDRQALAADEFVPGPGQTAPPIALVGAALTTPAPGAGQNVTHVLTFQAPSKEGIYKVRMNLNGTPPTGYYLGNSVIDVKTNRAVLLIRRARVLNYAHLQCKDDSGLAFPPPRSCRYRPPSSIRAAATARRPISRASRSRTSATGLRGDFSVIVTDTSGCNPPVTVAMPAIPPKKTAWVVKAVQFNKKPGGCGGPYTARVAARAGDRAATAASEILFQQVDLYTMKNLTDTATVQSFLASN